MSAVTSTAWVKYLTIGMLQVNILIKNLKVAKHIGADCCQYLISFVPF